MTNRQQQLPRRRLLVMNTLLYALLVLQAPFCFGGRNFRLGRSRGGNLGVPGQVHHDDNGLPEAQWFKQKLDHFSPTDLTTWKQVSCRTCRSSAFKLRVRFVSVPICLLMYLL